MEAYRPYLQVLQSLLQRSFISARAVAGCLIGSDRAVTTQCSCLLALEQGCPRETPFCHQGERGSEVPPVH